MQPWRISVGLTAAILAAPRLRYLAPYWPIVMADHGVAIALHLALATATVAAVVYVVARALGLADLGRRVALIERSVRRGDVAPELGRALERTPTESGSSGRDPRGSHAESALGSRGDEGEPERRDAFPIGREVLDKVEFGVYVFHSTGRRSPILGASSAASALFAVDQPSSTGGFHEEEGICVLGPGRALRVGRGGGRHRRSRSLRRLRADH